MKINKAFVSMIKYKTFQAFKSASMAYKHAKHATSKKKAVRALKMSMPTLKMYFDKPFISRPRLCIKQPYRFHAWNLPPYRLLENFL